MVANLSVGKGEFDPQYENLCALADEAQRVKDELLSGVDADTAAFNKVLEAMRLPKDTFEQKEARAAALSAGYKAAAKVPLRTAELCNHALQLCRRAAQIGNDAVMSDVGAGALMAFAGLQSAMYNVRINLPQIEDSVFIAEMDEKITASMKEAKATCEAVQREVETSLKKLPKEAGQEG
jgi:formiminotetrahydrofolate cyclodeaminase